MSMTLSEIASRIEAAEQRARYYDAAEHHNYMAERLPRERNHAELLLLRVQQAYQLMARDDWRGLECTEALDACDREACRSMLGAVR